jgi:hypothetical protein
VALLKTLLDIGIDKLAYATLFDLYVVWGQPVLIDRT